jgi:ribosomal protein S18 acetylase RimI-like enzyme
MPIISNLVQNPSPQDRIDIHKIFKDYPEAVSPADVDAWLDNGELYAASFNDRLLGACRLVSHLDRWQVDYLCVRKVTRRRGVAYKLILDLQQLAQQSKRTLFCHVPETLDAAAQQLVQKMGLTASENNQYFWSPDRGA